MIRINGIIRQTLQQVSTLFFFQISGAVVVACSGDIEISYPPVLCLVHFKIYDNDPHALCIYVHGRMQKGETSQVPLSACLIVRHPDVIGPNV